MANEARVQAVQPLVAFRFAHLKVAERVIGDRRVAAALAPDAQRDLLGHRAAGQKHRRLLTQQPGHFVLELLDQRALAVAIGQLVVTRLLN